MRDVVAVLDQQQLGLSALGLARETLWARAAVGG
jgi:hypothetical protein